MNISIRAETPGDIDAIARLTEAAFRNETHSSHTEQYIVDALRRAGALTLSLVAEANGQVIGHIAASPVTIDGEAGDWYGLAPLSVAPERQRQGLGSQLVRRLLTELRLLPAGGCVVLGEPTYYSRFGFRVESGAVEATVLKCAAIKEVVVKAFADEGGTNILCGYFTSDVDVDVKDLKAKLREILPYYMVPSCFIRLEEFPRNFNNKIDRKAIQPPKELNDHKLLERLY